MVLRVKRAASEGGAAVEPVRPAAEDAETADRILDAAEALFYGRGIQSVGVDEIRDRAGVPLKRLYQLFGSKDSLVVAVLERRDGDWHRRLASYVAQADDPEARILAVFDWLGRWF